MARSARKSGTGWPLYLTMRSSGRMPALAAALPSTTDLSDATYPDYLYVIVSPARPAGPQVRAYELQDGRFVEVEIVKS